MKKFLALACALVLTFGLVACGGSKNDTKNGTYTATMNESYAVDENRGYQDTLTVVYENGKIVDAKWDSLRIDTGVYKSTMDEEQYPMKGTDGETPFPPTEWIPELNANIVAAGNASGIDAVAGATSSSSSASTLLKAIEENGKAGEEIIVDFN